VAANPEPLYGVDTAGNNRRSWQVPAYRVDGTPSAALHDWASQNVKDGQDFAQLEPGFEQLEQSIRLLTGAPDEKLAAKQRDGRYSRIQTNRLKRNLREMITSLSDIAFTPGYHSDSSDMQGQAELLNKVAYSWYVSRFIDVQIKKAVQWMAICPRGWLEICYRQLPGERDKCDIDIIPRSSFEVVMTGVPESGDHQEAYTVTIIKDMPVYLAHATWPEFQDKLIPDRETPRGWIERARDLFETVSSVFESTPAKATGKNPTVRLFYQYVLDLSINKSGKTITVGQKRNPLTKQMEDTPWSYEVPSLGSPIKAGYDDKGIPVFRIAEARDCRMFPNRRLIVFTEKENIYDGPAFDWHGKVPLIKWSADSWPFGDFSMVRDVATIQDTINEVDRITHQTIRNRFNPSMKYDMRALARDKAKSVRTDLAGQRIGYNGQVNSDPLTPLLPQSFYEIEGWIYDARKMWSDDMDYQMGVHDISAIAKMKSAGDEDTLTKMAELAGPIVKGISRDMERSFRDMCEMFKYLVFQYYTTPKVMQIVGPDGVTPENFDFDPGNLVPSHLPGEDQGRPSVFSRQHRAMWMADHLPFMIVPNTLHRLNQTSQKLMFLQLARGGQPIDPWSLFDVLGIPNVGPKPAGANSVMELYFKWKEMEADFALAQQVKAQQALGEQGDIPTPEEVIHQIAEGGIPVNKGLGGEINGVKMGTPGTGPKGGPLGSSGRAPSAERLPVLRAKGDGRPVMVESK
jgi:hypothetical protein